VGRNKLDATKGSDREEWDYGPRAGIPLGKPYKVEKKEAGKRNMFIITTMRNISVGTFFRSRRCKLEVELRQGVTEYTMIALPRT
jgi:hypothetical protein